MIRRLRAFLFSRPKELLPPPDRSVRRQPEILDAIWRNYYRNRRAA
jgi:hypothetical protein